tara:strand:+ start:2060 stop:2458 length:399 start_codon:yes stop_codon:yes gene_type:complete
LKHPGKTDGLRHVALFVSDYEATEQFYSELFGMEVEWRPDSDNVYLTTGNDNLALHRRKNLGNSTETSLDHIGFFVNEREKIDHWFEFLSAHGVKIVTEPRDHRDGARSFYCLDPSGTRVQLIYHPPIANSV